MGSAQWFEKFHQSLTIPASKVAAIDARLKKITLQLNTEFWSLPSETLRMHRIGGYARRTAIDTSDINLLYEFPDTIYKESTLSPKSLDFMELLGQLKAVVEMAYAPCQLGKDQESVEITFTDGIRFHIVFGKTLGIQDHRFDMLTPKTKWKWRQVRPLAEIQAFKAADAAWEGELSRIGRMIRAWRDAHRVPMGGLHIDALALLMLGSDPHTTPLPLHQGEQCRRYFRLLASQSSNASLGYAHGSGELIWHRGNFVMAAQKAYELAVKALEFESSAPEDAKAIWRKIFGDRFPM